MRDRECLPCPLLDEEHAGTDAGQCADALEGFRHKRGDRAAVGSSRTINRGRVISARA